MANVRYPLGRIRQGNGDIDLTDDTIKVIALATGATYSAAHDDLADISANRYTGTTDQTLAAKTLGVVAAGVFDNTADITFSSLAIDGTDHIIALAVYDDTHASDALLAWYDTDSAASAIDVTPNGSDITITINTSGLFSV